MKFKAFSDENYMQRALEEAKKALEEDEVPVGAVIVSGNHIIGKGYNQTERLNDVTAHAEIIAISAASNYLGSKYLEDCTIYVSLEPCAMCAAAIAAAQITNVVYGAKDPKKGFTNYTPSLLHPKSIVKAEVLAEQSSEMLTNFFKSKRIQE